MEASHNQPPKPPSLPPRPPQPPLGKGPTGATQPRPKPIPVQPDPPIAPATPTPPPTPTPPVATPPPAPPSPQPPAQKTVGDLVIRTMHDDLQAKPATPPTAAPTSPASPATPAATPTQFPLPPRATGGGRRVVMKPRKKRRKKGKKWPLVILLLLFLTAAGAAAWLLLTGQGSSLISQLPFIGSVQPTPSSLSGTPAPTTSTPPSPVVAAPADTVLPADASSIVQYRLTSAGDRSKLLSAWNKKSTSASISTLLQGDPRLLLDDPDSTEFYYVTLEGDSRPSLVVPITTTTTELLASSTGVTTTQEQGWYIAHALSTTAYTTALANGSLADDGGDAVFNDTTPDTPLRLSLGPATLQALRADLLAPTLSTGQMQRLSLAVRFNQGDSVELSGQSTSLSAPPGIEPGNQQLLSLIPSSASFVRLGGNFANDLQQWQGTVGVLDDTFLATPEVSALVGEHTTPYAFFADTLVGGTTSFGFIVERPEGSTFTLESSELASALTALVPLITGQPRLLPLEFNTTTYNDIPLNFANLGSDTQAVDVALTPEYVFIATSKDTMLNLLTTTLEPQLSLNTGQTWSDLFSAWGAPATTSTLIAGILDVPQLSQLLPAASEVYFGFTLDPQTGSTSWQAQGAALLDPEPELINPLP